MHEVLTINEVARLFRVDDTTVRRWITNGTLDAVELPHSGRRRGYRVLKQTLDRILHPGHSNPATTHRHIDALEGKED